VLATLMEAPNEKQRYSLGVLVDNHAGALARIAGLFAGRGFNIDTLTVAPTLDPTVSRMTIVTEGDRQTLEQIAKQLNRLVDVIKVIEYGDGGERAVERELALVKVAVKPETRAEVLHICAIFEGKVVDLTRRTCVLEVTGGREKVEAMLDLLRPLGIQELVRTGRVAIGRGLQARTEREIDRS
jgi:acetolactate synthase-1/3 small subunit